MFDLSLLNHFIAVAQTRSFTRAATQVHASQSVVSRSIKRLEQEVGAALFERTTRSVTLTPAGEAFLAESLAIADRLAVATADARRIGEGDTTQLRIGICPSAEQETDRIAAGLAAFRDAWPRIDLKITAVMRNRQATALRSSEIDVGLMRLYHSDCEGLDWQVFAQDPLLVAVPAVWGLERRRIELKELRDRPWLMPHPDVAPDMHQLQMELCRGAGFEPKVAAFTNDPLTAKMMLACGLGATFANDPGVMQEGQRHVRMTWIEGVSQHFCSQTVVAWASNSRSAHIAEFARCIAEPPALRVVG